MHLRRYNRHLCNSYTIFKQPVITTGVVEGRLENSKNYSMQKVLTIAMLFFYFLMIF